MCSMQIQDGRKPCVVVRACDLGGEWCMFEEGPLRFGVLKSVCWPGNGNGLW